MDDGDPGDPDSGFSSDSGVSDGTSDDDVPYPWMRMPPEIETCRYDGIIWYASPNGSGDGRNPENPKSLSDLLEQDVNDGDIVILLPGSYGRVVRDHPRVGTDGCIKIVGQHPPHRGIDTREGERISIEPRDRLARFQGDFILKRYRSIHLEGFFMDGADLWIDRSQSAVLRLMESRSAASTGLLLTRVGKGLVEQCYIWDDMPPDDPMGDRSYQRTDYAVRVHRGDTVVIQYNLIEGTETDWVHPVRGRSVYFAFNQPVSIKEYTNEAWIVGNYFRKMGHHGIYLGQEADYKTDDGVRYDRTAGTAYVVGNIFDTWARTGKAIVAGNISVVYVEENLWKGTGNGRNILVVEYVTGRPPGTSSAIVGPRHPNLVVFRWNTLMGGWNSAVLKGRGILGDRVEVSYNYGNSVMVSMESLDWGSDGKQTSDPPELVLGPESNWMAP